MAPGYRAAMAPPPDPGTAAGGGDEEALAAFRHDLLTPLAVISGMAETLEAHWDRLEPEDRAQLLSSIRAQATRAAAMVNALGRPQPDQP